MSGTPAGSTRAISVFRSSWHSGRARMCPQERYPAISALRSAGIPRPAAGSGGRGGMYRPDVVVGASHYLLVLTVSFP